jgi:hypothetical protein
VGLVLSPVFSTGSAPALGDEGQGDLWVDGVHGHDAHDGMSPAQALRTIQRAANLATPGTVVHILPGVYRESVRPATSGTADKRVEFVAQPDAGRVVVRGSEPSSALSWTRLETNEIGLPAEVDPGSIYVTDLSSWGLTQAPRFVLLLDGEGEVAARLPLAREPDWQVVHDWKYHEFWWAADGGSEPAACDPATDPAPRTCDTASRSLTQLTDRTTDTSQPGIEPGNLTTLGDLTGATLVAIDTGIGHYVYRRTIIDHDPVLGRVTVDEICEHDHDSGRPGLGWGSKYYVEGAPSLLDTPGEWWYDSASGKLYLWPPTNANPAELAIEISRRATGVTLTGRSYITLEGLTVEFFNEDAIRQRNADPQVSHSNWLRKLTLRYANRGVMVRQWIRDDTPDTHTTDDFLLEDSEIAYIDTLALDFTQGWAGDSPEAFFRPALYDTAILRNSIHHIGHRTDGDDATGSVIVFADRFRFEGNHVAHVGHNGVQFMRAVNQSAKTYGLDPDEIRTGEILIRDNLFEKACELTTDCGALKISGGRPEWGVHVFRDVLVTGNVFRDTIGWTYAAEQREHFQTGPSSTVKGMGGAGLYIDMASGLHIYRNIAYNNAYFGFRLAGVWRDGDIVIYNNVLANAMRGLHLGSADYDTHGSVNTQVANNLILNNEAYGMVVVGADRAFDNLVIDHNLYFRNGWRPEYAGGAWGAGDMIVEVPGPNLPFCCLDEIQAGTRWETHGRTGDPRLWDYDLDAGERFDGAFPDFNLTVESLEAIDTGTAWLPASLVDLLQWFGITDRIRGTALDIGRYEAGYTLLASPAVQYIGRGESASFTVSLEPGDLPYPVTLTARAGTPDLRVSLESSSLLRGESTTLHVTHTGSSLPEAGANRILTVTGTGGGFTVEVRVALVVGYPRMYLPVVVRAAPESHEKASEG